MSLGHFICDPDFTNIRSVDLMTWGLWMNDRKHRIVARTETDRGFVSTVFLGIDHGWGRGEPVLFETMIFSPGYDCDQDQHRYTNVTDARRGHAMCVEMLKNAPKVWDEL